MLMDGIRGWIGTIAAAFPDVGCRYPSQVCRASLSAPLLLEGVRSSEDGSGKAIVGYILFAPHRVTS
jgi:hypothetical protein